MSRGILILSTLLLSATLSAQVSEDRNAHAVEITTGYPAIFFQLEYPMFKGVEKSKGVMIEGHYQPGINMGYTFSWNRRWEANALGNLHLTILDRVKYPEIPGSGTTEYDFDAEPEYTTREFNIYGAVCASVRYKWLIRDTFSMYSALGAGVQLNGYPIPLPYIAPFGIKFGKGRVYGLAEMNLTSANTFGMVGLGIRL